MAKPSTSTLIKAQYDECARVEIDDGQIDVVHEGPSSMTMLRSYTAAQARQLADELKRAADILDGNCTEGELRIACAVRHAEEVGSDRLEWALNTADVRQLLTDLSNARSAPDPSAPEVKPTHLLREKQIMENSSNESNDPWRTEELKS